MATTTATRRPASFASLPEDIHATWLSFAGLPEIRSAVTSRTIDAEVAPETGLGRVLQYHRDGSGGEYLVHTQKCVLGKAMGSEIAEAIVTLNAVESGAMHPRWLELRLLCHRVCAAVEVNIRETMAIDGAFRDMAARQRRCEANTGIAPLEHLGLGNSVEDGEEEEDDNAPPQRLMRRALQQQPPVIANPFSVQSTDAMPVPPFLVQPPATERALCAFLTATSIATPANIRALMASLLPPEGGGGGALGWPRGSPLGVVVQRWLLFDDGGEDNGTSERLVDVFDCTEAEWTPDETEAAAQLSERRMMREFIRGMAPGSNSAAVDAERAAAEKEEAPLLAKRPEHKGVHDSGETGETFAHRVVDLVANEALFVFATAQHRNDVRDDVGDRGDDRALPAGAVECLPPRVRRLLARHFAVIYLSDATPLLQLDESPTRPALTAAFHPGKRRNPQQTLPDLTRQHDALLLPLPWPGFLMMMRDSSTLRWSWGASTLGLTNVPAGIAKVVFPPSSTRIVARCLTGAAELDTIDLTRCVDLKDFGARFATHSTFQKLLLPPTRPVPGVEKLDVWFVEHSLRVAAIDLTSLVNLTTIKEHAFADCRALHTLKLPGSVSFIHKYFCANCRSLRRLDLGHLHSLQQIGAKAFDGVPRVHLTLSPRAVEAVEMWALPRHSVFVLVAADDGDGPEHRQSEGQQQQQQQIRADSEVWDDW